MPEHITSAVARSHLPAYTQDLAVDIMNMRSGMAEFSDFERSVVYTHYLVARGDLQSLINYLDAKPADERHMIVNHTLYDTWFGNTLHTCLYWNTDTTALNIYRYLTNCGAVPVRDYYEQFPWEIDGIAFICPLRGFNVAGGCERDSSEFTATHADILRYFGPVAGAGAASVTPQMPSVPPEPTWSWSPSTVVAAEEEQVGACPLHRPGSLYTRNSNGYYGSFAPACTGCAVGERETEEHDVAETISNLMQSLRFLWRSHYNDESVLEARNMAEFLRERIAHLRSLTNVIVTPIDYAERVLDIHNAAMNLHNALTRGHGPSILESLIALQPLMDDSTAPILVAARDCIAVG